MGNRFLSLFIYLFVMILGVLFFGAIHTWVYTIVFLGVIAASLLLLRGEVAVEAGTARLRWLKTGLTPLFFFFLAYLILQMTPLPQWLLLMISPEAKIAGAMSQPAAAALNPADLPNTWYALAPYLYPVRMSLVRWVVYGLFFFGLIRCLDSRRRIEAAVITILVLCCFDALYGIVQTYSGNDRVWWFKLSGSGRASRDVSGTYLNRNHFAGLMEMGIALAIAYAGALGGKMEEHPDSPRRPVPFKKRFLAFFSERGMDLRYFLVIFAGGIMGLGLILSASRGGIIAMAGALLLMGLLFYFRKGERRKGRIILILFSIALIFSIYAGLDYTVARFDAFDRDMENRWVRAERTIDLFRDNPYAGVGIGNFRHAYGKYQHPRDVNFYVDYAHNDYAQFLAEAGIAGGMLLIAGMGWYMVRIFRRWLERKDSFAVCLGIAPFGALSALAIHSFTDYNLHRPANMLVLIAVIAIGFAALNMENRRGNSRTAYGQRMIPLWPWGGLLLAGAAGLILWSGVWTIRHFIAETHCNTDRNITLNLKENPSADEARSAIAWDPGNAMYRHKLVRALAHERDRRMQGPTPDREGWKLSHGPIIEALEAAIRLNPLNAETHLWLAWEYSYLFDRPDYRSRWLPAADICLERAEWFAGDWPENPRLQYDMGNYLAMRINTLAPDDPKRDPGWARAAWHYRKGMELEKKTKLPEDVGGYLANFFKGEIVFR
jgi:O-antigen ligase